MTSGRAGAWARLIVPVVAPAILLVDLRAFPSLDLLLHSATFHLIVVSAIAICALIVAFTAALAGARSGEHGPVWLAAGCLCVGILMLLHGLLTPGVLGRSYNEWIGRAPHLALALFAIGVALAGRPRNRRTSRLASRAPGLVLSVPVLTLGLLSVVTLNSPTAAAGTHDVSHEAALLWVLAVLTAVVLSCTAVVHWRRWRLGHDPIQYALVLASIMSIAAIASLKVGLMWKLSWWDYHVFLLAGFGGAVYAVVIRYRRTRTVDDVLAATFDTDPMIHIVQGYPDALKALVGAVERKDSYTHGHSQRTAQVAVQLALRLGVNDDVLRAVARGGYLHDVGKIAIPDVILNKPGALTREEREVIETHPQVGHDLVLPITSLHEVLPAVLHHHERWDGTGYPRALASDGIPLVARIVALADVWDALTSDRSYRPGLTPGAALAHIAAGSGTHFDPQLVTAFLGLAADWGYSPDDTQPGDARTASAAADTCHEATLSRA
jgi:HD-GYP domain-containing protein (c-di-GMP phosphodiesterase class II)